MSSASAAVAATAFDAHATAAPNQAAPAPPKENKAEARARRKAEAIARTLAAQQQQPAGSADAAVVSSAAARPSGSGLCEYYLARKHRLCSFPISSSSARFCAHHNCVESGADKTLCPFCHTAIRTKDRPHAVQGGAEAAAADHASSAAASSSHHASSFAPRLSPLDRHLLICPKRLTDISATQLPFYDKSCNGVWRTDDSATTPSNDANAAAAAAASEENPGSDGHAPVSAAVSSLSDVPRVELMLLIDKLQAIAARLGITPDSLRKIEEEQWKLLQQSRAADAAAPAHSKPNDADAMTDAADAAATPSPSLPTASSTTVLSNRSRARHNLQHASFFRVLAQHGVEFGPAVATDSSASSSSSGGASPSSGTVAPGSVVIEVGAGKAGLSGFIAGNMAAASSSSSSSAAVEHAPAPAASASNKRAKTEATSSTASVSPAAAAAATAAAAASSSFDVPPPPPPAPLTLVVLDRGSFKHKADTAMRKSASCKLLRYRVDLQDVRLERMEEVQAVAAAAAAASNMHGARKPVAMVTGKHVCGQATDFVLRAVARANAPAVAAAASCSSSSASSSSPASAPASAAPPLISLVCIATCCHHLCSWGSYVSQSWMQVDLGLDAREFARIARITSWYTCGHQQHSEHRAAEAPAGTAADAAAAAQSAPATASVGTAAAAAVADPLPPALKVWIGFVCKQLLDLGRVRYLAREAGLARVAGREAYTHSSITREHFVIMASA